MSKALKSNNKLLLRENKIVAHTGGNLYTGLGTARKTYFLRNGKVVSTTNGKPYRAVGLSPIMRENTWAEIGNAIKLYPEIGLPWELGDYKEIEYEDPDFHYIHTPRAVFVGDNDIVDERGNVIGHEYNFMTEQLCAFETIADIWDGIRAMNYSFNGHLLWEEYDDENNVRRIAYEYEKSAAVDYLLYLSNSISQRNNFGVAQLEDLAMDEPYYDVSQRARIYGEVGNPYINRPRPVGLYLTIPTLLDLTNMYNSSDYPAQSTSIIDDYSEEEVEIPFISGDNVTKNSYGNTLDFRYIKDIFSIQDATERQTAFYSAIEQITGEPEYGNNWIETRSIANMLVCDRTKDYGKQLSKRNMAVYKDGGFINQTGYTGIGTILSLKALY